MIYYQSFSLANEQVIYERRRYNSFDLIGDIAGVKELLVFVIGIFMCRWSEFGFNLKVLENLYIASTKDNGLLGGKDKDEFLFKHNIPEYYKGT